MVEFIRIKIRSCSFSSNCLMSITASSQKFPTALESDGRNGHHFIKTIGPALAGVACWLEHWPVTEGLLIWFSVREHTQVLGSIPSWGVCEKAIDWCFSLSLSKAVKKKVLWWTLKEKIKTIGLGFSEWNFQGLSWQSQCWCAKRLCQLISILWYWRKIDLSQIRTSSLRQNTRYFLLLPSISFNSAM